MLNIKNKKPMSVGGLANQFDTWAAMRLIKPILICVVDGNIVGVVYSYVDAVAIGAWSNKTRNTCRRIVEIATKDDLLARKPSEANDHTPQIHRIFRSRGSTKSQYIHILVEIGTYSIECEQAKEV